MYEKLRKKHRMRLPYLARKVQRNVEDYRWWVTAKKSLATSVASIYKHQVYRIYRIDIETTPPREESNPSRFALRLLDLAAIMREMANRSRECDIEGFSLHDKKAHEWFQNLERWVRKAQAEMEMRIIESRARRRALTASD